MKPQSQNALPVWKTTIAQNDLQCHETIFSVVIVVWTRKRKEPQTDNNIAEICNRPAFTHFWCANFGGQVCQVMAQSYFGAKLHIVVSCQGITGDSLPRCEVRGIVCSLSKGLAQSHLDSQYYQTYRPNVYNPHLNGSTPITTRKWYHIQMIPPNSFK